MDPTIEGENAQLTISMWGKATLTDLTIESYSFHW